MKLRKIRKRQYRIFFSHRAFLWSVKKLVFDISEKFDPITYALQQAWEAKLKEKNFGS